ncbi:hypothetical protein T4C_4219 [Trichinella pseudospiralis]|uniref:Uncharacterized protein n=2 Tax=Trichinella TaxID=6333 RepID=A0A0V1LY67_9BILA|nr:hypothetical protein T4C_4219 [Trichinella pseudospiralis]KRZ64467.1 hypothetical protein T10_5975 [Trichinella papuae]
MLIRPPSFIATSANKWIRDPAIICSEDHRNIVRKTSVHELVSKSQSSHVRHSRYQF